MSSGHAAAAGENNKMDEEIELFDMDQIKSRKVFSEQQSEEGAGKKSEVMGDLNDNNKMRIMMDFTMMH